MDVDRHPRVVVDRVRQRDERAAGGHALRRHHERQPRIGDEHDARADEVEAKAQSQVHQRMELSPAVVIGVEEEGLREEQQDVGQERRRKHAHQVVRELRIQDDEHERQDRAEGGGDRERHRQQLRELVREPVVAQVAGLVANRLDDEREDRDGEDERGEQQVELRRHPDGHAAADERKRPVLALPGRACPAPSSFRRPPRPSCLRPAVFDPRSWPGPDTRRGTSLFMSDDAILMVIPNITSPRTGPRTISSLRFFIWPPCPAACVRVPGRRRRSPSGPLAGSASDSPTSGRSRW